MLKYYVKAGETLADLKSRLRKDESGAALVEYSVLIGLITVAAVTAIISVGGWVGRAWSDLVAVLP